MALWNKDVYAGEQPVEDPKLICYSYVDKLRADANFAPSFQGIHFERIRHGGLGITPVGSGADRFGVEDGGKLCRFWYDYLEISEGEMGRLLIDAGCEWSVLNSEAPYTNHSGVLPVPGIVTVANPKLDTGLNVVIFSVKALKCGETVIVLQAKEPQWFLNNSREQRKQDVKLEKKALKRDAIQRAKQAEARRLIYGDDPPPDMDERDGSGKQEIPPLWGELQMHLPCC